MLAKYSLIFHKGDMMKRKKKGNIDSGIMFIIAIFFLGVFFVSMSEKIDAPMKYIKLHQVCRKYLLKMEKDGGLSPFNVNNLNEELIKRGFIISDIKINPETTLATPDVKFGDDVTLSVSYKYKLKNWNVDGFNISHKFEEKIMNVDLSTTSKKGT